MELTSVIEQYQEPLQARYGAQITPAQQHAGTFPSGYPAQHDSFATSLSNVCAASFTPSDSVR